MDNADWIALHAYIYLYKSCVGRLDCNNNNNNTQLFFLISSLFHEKD